LGLLPDDASPRIGEWIASFAHAELVDCGDLQRNPRAARWLAGGASDALRVPFWRWKPGQMKPQPESRVDILACEETLAIGRVLADAIAESWPGFAPTRVLMTGDAHAGPSQHHPLRLREMLDDFDKLRLAPHCLVDLSGEQDLAPVYIETVVRAGTR